MNHTKQKRKQAVLAVSFGTTDLFSLNHEVGAAERAVAEALPDFEFRRAFASRFIIDRLKRRDGIQVDHIAQALERAADDGITVLAVQPTYFTYGYEYAALEHMLREKKDRFERIYLGQPLLHSDTDLETAVSAAVQKTAAYDDGKTAICFMGHGTKQQDASGFIVKEDDGVYIRLQEKFARAGYKNHYVAAMQAVPSFEELAKKLQRNGIYQRTVLMPLMLSAGRHAERDMAGDGQDSWKSRLLALGYEVVCVMEGFGRIELIQKLYAAHACSAVKSQNYLI